MDARIRPAAGFVPFARADLARSIPDRFADQVGRHATRLAIGTREVTLTYEELDWMSNRVADAVLAVLGAAPHRVALLLAQGAPLVAAILGVLKAGKAYVPLDPFQPRPRRDAVLAHARPGLCLVDAEHAGLTTISGGHGLRSIEVDSIVLPRPAPPAGVKVSPDALAYLYYTSGSTGEPKGVLDSHRNVLHNVMRYTNSLGIGPDDRLTLLQGPAFSGAVSSLFAALLNGAAIFPFDVRREGADRIAPWVARAALRLPAMRVVRLEGDLAAPGDVELFQARCEAGAVLVNGLGATECGLVRQYVVDHATRLAGATVPIGYAVEDMDVVLHAPDGRPVGPGDVGEIVVRSPYLATGYWDRPDLTEAAFQKSPAGNRLRLYRTGDMGRMAPDGCLEHLGRRDHQVKVRGERLDVGAIEAALVASGVAREAVVTARGTHLGDVEVVAYLVPASGDATTASALRRRLTAGLPAHAVPARFVRLDALPLDTNGKVDRRALPAPERSRPELDVPFVEPRTERERVLAAVWRSVLGLAQVGVEDDFFELGGDSLRAVELLAEVAQATGADVAVADFAPRPTIAALAALVEGAGSPAGSAGEAVAPTLFFLHSDYGGTGAECAILARHLGRGLRLVGLAPDGAEEGAGPATIESMAAGQLRRVRALQPRGPYALAGHCSAGVVAFELARQLRAAGEVVEPLVLVEPPPLRALRGPGGRSRRLRSLRLRHVAHRARSLATRARAAVAEGRLLDVVARAIRSLRGARGPLPSTPGLRRADLAHAAAVARYVGGRYPGRVTFIRTEASVAIGEFDPGLWREAAEGLQVHVVPGDHESCLAAAAGALAERLRASLTIPEDGPDRGFR